MDADIWVARLTGEQAAQVWDKVEAMLADAIRGSLGLYTNDDVRDLVTSERWSLWIVADRTQLLGAWTTCFRHYPRESVLEVIQAGGQSMDDWYDLAVSKTEDLAREAGCKRMHCAGRPGWRRRGWKQIGHLHERMLA